jgi:hypothetical protein
VPGKFLSLTIAHSISEPHLERIASFFRKKAGTMIAEESESMTSFGIRWISV